MELNEQEIVRRQALEELRKLGIDPYPARLVQFGIVQPHDAAIDWLTIHQRPHGRMLHAGIWRPVFPNGLPAGISRSASFHFVPRKPQYALRSYCTARNACARNIISLSRSFRPCGKFSTSTHRVEMISLLSRPSDPSPSTSHIKAVSRWPGGPSSLVNTGAPTLTAKPTSSSSSRRSARCGSSRRRTHPPGTPQG